MNADNIEKTLMAILNSPTIQQIRKLQEQIDTINNLTYPVHEYNARLNETIKMVITPPELKILSDWFKKNQEMENMINSLTGTEHLVNYLNQKIRFNISTIPSFGENGYEQLLLNTYSEDVDEEEKEEIKEVNNKIVSEILKPNSDIAVPSKDTSKIVVLPINNDVLKYFSDNPNELFKLTGTQFEDVMAEVYSRLGYHVTQTKKTRDGGKDLIIRKPNALGNFVYYVECKKYSKSNPVGVGIVREVAGTLSVDRVNAGIIATTSHFTKDARDFILNNNMQYQIHMHDFDKIQSLLKKVTQIRGN